MVEFATIAVAVVGGVFALYAVAIGVASVIAAGMRRRVR
jgi:hypothetical protein